MKKGFLMLFILALVLLSFGMAFGARDKDTVVIVQGVDPTTMDPHNHMETPAWNLHIQLFDMSSAERPQHQDGKAHWRSRTGSSTTRPGNSRSAKA